jgi:hypothetical protein
MNDQVPATPRSSFDSFVLNVATLIAWWMLLGLAIFTMFPHGFPRELSRWYVGDTTILLACVVGTAGALAIRRNGAAYVLAGFAAFLAVELGFHLHFGVRTVQGGPAHFADMAAGILAVTFSALVERGSASVVNNPVWNARAIGESAMRAGFALRHGIGYRAHVVLGLVALAASELAVRAVFGWIWYLSGNGWRLRHLFLDGKTNYAILSCALPGAALGAVVGKWGHRLAIPTIRRGRAMEQVST